SCAAALISALLITAAGRYAAYSVCVCSVVAAVVLIAARPRAKRTGVIVCAALFAVSLSFSLYLSGLAYAQRGEAAVRGYILPDGDTGYSELIRVTSVNGVPADFKAVTDSRVPGSYAYAGFEAEMTFRPVDTVNADYYKSKGAVFSAAAESVRLTGKTRRGIGYYASALREYAAGCLYKCCDEAGIMCRLFLGMRDGAPASFLSDMRTLGVSHLLAVSGLHVTALLAGADAAISAIFGKRRCRFIFLSALALLYMAVTGFSGSVTRAALMYLIGRSSVIIGKRNDPPTSLCFAAFLIVAVNPPSAADTGFLMSFTATLGIITLGSPLSAFLDKKLPEKLFVLKKLLSAVLVTVSAVLFTLPVAAQSYGTLAYGAIFYNLVTAPVAAVLLYLAPYVILLSPVPFLGRFAGTVCDGLCSFLQSTAHALAENGIPSVSVQYPFVLPLLFVSGAALIVLAAFSKKRLHYLSLALAFIVSFSALAAVFSLTTAKKTVIIVSAGRRGDLVAALDGGRCTIFDFTSGYADGFYPLCRKLLEFGVTHADLVSASDVTARHIQSAARMCRYFDIDAIYFPKEAAETAAAFCGREVRERDGDESGYGGVSLVRLYGKYYMSVKDAVYCYDTDDDGAGYLRRFGTVVYGGAVTENRGSGNNVYYVNENGEGRAGITVIYVG
ncbi:MAG: ComEC/Rec2 family competence protein, partial [Clostridia bacterium]|nr:ComEC/Rec2 family competence protein [Clostridia bacterium]